MKNHIFNFFPRREKVINQIRLYAVPGGGWETKPSPGDTAVTGSGMDLKGN